MKKYFIVFKNLLFTKNSLYVFILGILSVLSFAPLSYSFLIFITLGLFFYLLEKSNNKMFLTYIFSLGFFGFGISWVYISVDFFTNSFLISFLTTFIFINVLAVYSSLFGFFIQKTFNNHKVYIKLFIIYPCLFVLLEWIRSFLFTGFPWLYIGYSQTNNILAFFASFGSVFLVSFFTIIISSTLTSTIFIFKYSNNINYKFLLILLNLFLIFIIYLCANIIKNTSYIEPKKDNISVSLVQSDIKQTIKWDSNNIFNILRTQYRLVSQENSDWIILAENTIPIFKNMFPKYFNDLNNLVLNKNISLLVGKPLTYDDGKTYYNSVEGFGLAKGIYKKHHLVPFGEYFPLKWLIGSFLDFMNIPMSDFSAGEKIQKPILMGKIPVTISICYEIAFPELTRLNSKNSDIIILISDDGWFGDSFGPWQHIEMAQMRAIENHRYVLSATNDGITAIINEKGEIIDKLPQFKQDVLKGNIELFNNENVFQKVGIYPFMIFFLLILVGIKLTNILLRKIKD